jgi:hypothetical protein
MTRAIAGQKSHNCGQTVCTQPSMKSPQPVATVIDELAGLNYFTPKSSRTILAEVRGNDENHEYCAHWARSNYRGLRFSEART